MENVNEIAVALFKISDKKLTQDQVDEYVRNGITCPFCGETNLEPSNCDMNDGSVTQYISCNNCGGYLFFGRDIPQQRKPI